MSEQTVMTCTFTVLQNGEATSKTVTWPALLSLGMEMINDWGLRNCKLESYAQFIYCCYTSCLDKANLIYAFSEFRPRFGPPLPARILKETFRSVNVNTLSFITRMSNSRMVR